nr:hypothetical protein [uncultured Microbacterium sp.]
MRDDCVFNLVHGDVAGSALAVVAPDAEVVEVLDLGSPYRALNDESVVAHTALGVALTAEHAALEVVLVDPPPLARAPSVVEHVLYSVEHITVDDRGVPSVEGLTLVSNLADVVAVPEKARHLRCGDRARRPRDRGAGRQSPDAQLVDDVVHCVLAAGVEIEGEGDERRTFGVHDDGIDLAALEHLGDVEVAQRCLAQGAAVLGFLPHLVRDVGAVLAGAVLVEGGEDAVHELADG